MLPTKLYKAAKVFCKFAHYPEITVALRAQCTAT